MSWTLLVRGDGNSDGDAAVAAQIKDFFGDFERHFTVEGLSKLTTFEFNSPELNISHQDLEDFVPPVTPEDEPVEDSAPESEPVPFENLYEDGGEST
jgi:hypothetical protein